MEITLHHVSKRYAGRVQALDDITTQLGPGVTGLLGPNGAGKSTLMNLLVGLDSPSQGQICLDGRPLAGLLRRYYAALGYLPQQFAPYGSLAVGEYMDYMAIMKDLRDGPARRARVAELLEVLHLTEYRARRIKTLSGGLRQRLGIAQALLNDPRVLVLDEPTAGLDPEERLQFRNLLAGLAFGRTVLLSSHIISDLSASCERLVILERGRLIYGGSPRDLCRRARGRVWEARVAAGQFERFQHDWQVIGSRSLEGAGAGDILARVISEDAPNADSTALEPSLEDAYLVLRREVRA